MLQGLHIFALSTNLLSSNLYFHICLLAFGILDKKSQFSLWYGQKLNFNTPNLNIFGKEKCQISYLRTAG